MDRRKPNHHGAFHDLRPTRRAFVARLVRAREEPRALCRALQRLAPGDGCVQKERRPPYNHPGVHGTESLGGARHVAIHVTEGTRLVVWKIHAKHEPRHALGRDGRRIKRGILRIASRKCGAEETLSHRALVSRVNDTPKTSKHRGPSKAVKGPPNGRTLLDSVVTLGVVSFKHTRCATVPLPSPSARRADLAHP